MANQKFLVSIILIIILGVIGFSIYKFGNDSSPNQASITNFEECAKAGNPVMESYPAQCRTASGELFVQVIENPDSDQTSVVTGGCFVGGCSGQICSDQEGMMSTCEYREEYACYKNAKCERQVSGQCGWMQNTALKACLDNPLSKVAVGYVSGNVTIGPFCPVEKVDELCKVPSEAYTSREAVVYASNGTTVKERVNLDTQGNYKIVLAPGNYFIQIVPAGIGPGEKKPVTVKSFEIATVNFDIDTGIR